MFNQKKVKEWFEYRDGSLYWKINYGSGPSLIGKRAGCEEKHKKGVRRFIRIRVDGKRTRFAESRLIFLYHKGYLPEQVDHKNRNQLDNRIENLRPATVFKNNMNVAIQKNNSTGFKGVSKSQSGKRYRATCCHVHLGTFDTAIGAAKAYDIAAYSKYGDFAYLNFNCD